MQSTSPAFSSGTPPAPRPPVATVLVPSTSSLLSVTGGFVWAAETVVGAGPSGVVWTFMGIVGGGRVCADCVEGGVGGIVGGGRVAGGMVTGGKVGGSVGGGVGAAVGGSVAWGRGAWVAGVSGGAGVAGGIGAAVAGGAGVASGISGTTVVSGGA